MYRMVPTGSSQGKRPKRLSPFTPRTLPCDSLSLFLHSIDSVNTRYQWRAATEICPPCSKAEISQFDVCTALKRMPKQKRARGRPKKNWMEGIRKAMNERNLNEGQWEDRKQWSLGVGQRRKDFWNRYIYIYIYIYIFCNESEKWPSNRFEAYIRFEGTKKTTIETTFLNSYAISN